MRWSPGDTVAFWDGAVLDFAVVDGEEKRRLRLIRAGGRDLRVPSGRLAFVVETGGEAPGHDAAACARAGERAAAAADRARSRAAAIDVALVWELASDAGTAVGLDALAALALEEDDGAARAAVVLAFLEDGLHFVRKGDHWEPREPETVAALRHEREVALRRETEREAAHAVLAEAGRGRDVEPGSRPPGIDRYLEALEEVVLLDLDAADGARRLAQEALAAAGVRGERPPEAAFRLLRRFGRWDHDDANVEIDRHGLRTVFPDDVLDDARRSAARGFDRDGRVDRTDLVVVTVDDARTREIDDGLSVEPGEDGGFVLGVHIADPSAFVSPESPADVEARRRGATYYFPDRKLPMLPEVLCEDAASLVEGALRPALTFRIALDSEGRVVDASVERSVVRPSRRLTYDEADAVLAAPGDDDVARTLVTLSAVTASREACRVAAGALRLITPEVDVRVGEDGEPRLDRLPGDSPSRRIVTEAMIAAGQAAATCAARAGVPLVHRRQAAPDGANELAGRTVVEAHEVRRVRMGLRRGETGVEPGPHFALGVAAYAQATSPLRRYADLANHRQLIALAAGRTPPCDERALADIAAVAERAERDGRRAERAAVRYWLLRHLAAGRGDTVSGTVVGTEGRTVVRLDETLLEETVSGLEGARLGDRVRLAVVHVNPRADVLKLRPETVP